MKLPEGVKFCRGSLVFYQDADDMDAKEMHQELKIEIADGGGGPYLVLTTKRWAINGPDDIETLCKVAMDFANELSFPKK